MAQATTPPARMPPPTAPPTARSSRRQRFAGAVLVAGCLVLIGSYFLPWVYSAPACGFPRYCGTGETRTGWAQVGIYLNPTTQDWKWTIQTLLRGDATALGMVTVFLFLYVGVPLALVWFGGQVWRREQPPRAVHGTGAAVLQPTRVSRAGDARDRRWLLRGEWGGYADRYRQPRAASRTAHPPDRLTPPPLRGECAPTLCRHVGMRQSGAEE